MGFVGPERPGLLEQLGVELDGRGNVARDDRWATNVDDVFVCGDMGRGQSLIVWAIAEGRSAAAAVDRHLMGETLLPAPLSALSSGRPELAEDVSRRSLGSRSCHDPTMHAAGARPRPVSAPPDAACAAGQAADAMAVLRCSGHRSTGEPDRPGRRPGISGGRHRLGASVP